MTTEQTVSAISAKVVADSVAPNGIRLITFQLKYPRFILAEVNTHKVLSKSSKSSRAVPTAKILEQVRTDPAMPCHWGSNQPGMQAGAELNEFCTYRAKQMWADAAWKACQAAEGLLKLGLHKQVVNRILEPFQWTDTVITGTEWTNFFELRDHDMAEPNFHLLASTMRNAMNASAPSMRIFDRDSERAWHLPYISDYERLHFHVGDLAQISAARCARVSFANHDGTAPNVVKDMELFEILVGSRPQHASPCEHQGYPLAIATQWSKNFRGWRQFRDQVEWERNLQCNDTVSAV